MKKLLTVLFCVILVTGLILTTSCRREEPAPVPPPVVEPEPVPEPPVPEPVPEPEPEPEPVPVVEPPVDMTRERAADPDRPDQRTGGDFYIAVGEEPGTLDPHLAASPSEQQLSMALFEGLLAFDPMNGRAVGGLAESWTVSPDGLEYTFTLREAKWSDGEAITAQTVVDSWMRAMNPATRSPFAWYYAVIEGAEAYLTGEAGPDAVQIEAVDEKTFSMTLIGDVPAVVEGLAAPAFAVIPVHAIETHGAGWSMPDRVVVNGAFKIEMWAPGDFIALTPNSHYWDAENVFLDAVVYFPVADAAEAFEMYDFGEVDWISAVPADRLPRVRGREDFHQVPAIAAEFEALINEAAGLEGEARVEALQKADALFEALVAGTTPDFSYYIRNMIDTSVWGGWFPNVMGFHPVKDLYLK